MKKNRKVAAVLLSLSMLISGVVIGATGCSSTDITVKETSVETKEDTTETAVEETPSREAGLYNFDGEMIKDWETLLAEDFLKVEDGILSQGSSSINDLGVVELVIADGVTAIGQSAFVNCDRLTSVEIPNTVTAIGVYAFAYCSELMKIEIPSSVTSIYRCAFDGIPWLEEKQKENPLVIVNHILIDGSTCEGDVQIPDGVTIIGEDAFWKCRGLTSIEIPDSVTVIGSEAFVGCSSLTSIEIPDSVTSIGGSNLGSFDEFLTSVLWRGTTFHDVDLFMETFYDKYPDEYPTDYDNRVYSPDY